jgi:hypothetical protein
VPQVVTTFERSLSMMVLGFPLKNLCWGHHKKKKKKTNREKTKDIFSLP